MSRFSGLIRAVLVISLALSVASCDPQVYGSIGVSSSSWGGYSSGPRLGGSISVGGCLTCR